MTNIEICRQVFANWSSRPQDNEPLFHADAVDQAGALAARLIHEDPAGFTVATFREQAGVSRKYALPLLAELDARGVTRRRDDVRIAGPRLPA